MAFFVEMEIRPLHGKFTFFIKDMLIPS